MSYENLIPGNYEATLTDWSLEVVEKISAPKITLIFEFDFQDKNYKMKFDSFVFKRDGEINKKTLDTLKTCGFKSSKITDLLDDPGALNTMKKYDIQVIKDEQGYWRIEWVNHMGGRAMDKVSAKKSLQGFDFSKVNGGLMKEGFGKKPRNFAPGASNEIDEELGF